ncbi:MAG TPA: molybdate ABC transporter substrate-binding protein [Actinomycetaceae bacterium]|nr:molybdate ABC transporter substrate-binding protein [Actinomycetaceae bacterium]
MKWIRTAAVAILAAGLVGCASDTGADDATSAPPAEEAGNITIFAAASLEKAFTELSDVWAESHDAELTFSYGGSNGLVDQIVEGAPADVLVTADATTMDRAVEEGVATDARPLTTNSLVLALAPGNPGGFETAEEALAGERLVVCAEEVPCGRATLQLMELSGLEMSPVSQEQNVTDVRGKIESGEANSGVIYRTDAASTGLDILRIPGADEVVTTSFTALVTDGDPAGAEFAEFLHSDEAREVLDSYGFGTP